jgi:predicted AlkP superfamily pyrophosphatase or phosphodiesterase
MKRLLVFAAIVFFLLALSPAPAVQIPPTPAPVSAATRPTSNRVLIISVDGLRPDLLLRAQAPNLRRLLDESSFTLWARTTAQSITLPSHTSMLTGVTPNVHQVFWNQDLPFSEPVYPAVPTLFELAHNAGYSTALIAGKSKFQHLAKPGTLDEVRITASDDDTVSKDALEVFRKRRPEVMFVHFPGTDNVGHAKGWGSPEQLVAVANADRHIGLILAELDAAGLDESTYIIISADHGGAGLNHGPDDPRSRTIPWIFRGPGVRKGYDLARVAALNVNTEDTFATACHVLKIPLPPKTEGRPVLPAFVDLDLLKPAGEAGK